MTLYNALTIQSGVTRQIHSSDVLVVGNGIDADTAVALTLGSATATAITLAKNTTISSTNTFTTGSGTVTINGATVFAGVGVTASGAGNFDFSGSSGTFLTSTGANTLSGNTTISGSNTFTTGSGAVTIQGNVTTSGNPGFDFSGSTSNFKTSSGNVSLNGNTTVADGKNFVFQSSTSQAGDFTLNGHNASSISTAGSLTITAAANSTWKTTTGALTLDAASALNLGTTTATSVSISRTGETTTVNGALTVTQATTLSALGTGVVHASSVGLLSSSLISVGTDVTGGTSGQFLVTNGSTPTWTTASGDATLTGAGHFTVTALQGNPVYADTLGSGQNGYVLTWDNADGYWHAATATSVVTLSGDVTGASNSNTVVKINGTSVPATPSATQILIAQSGTASLWETLSQDATLASGGAVTVVSAHGNFDVGVGGTSTLTIDGAGNFTTGTGTNTIKGNVTTSGNPNFDFSGSAGTFMTSTGAVTVGGAATFTAAGTALTVNNNATVTSALTAGSVLTSTLDTAAAGALAIGPTHATSVAITPNTTVTGTLTSTGLLTASNALTVTSGNITTPLTHWGTVQINGSGVLTSSAGTSGQLLISQGASAASTWNTLSGDGTISSSGVLTVTQAAGNFEVKGNLMVDGAETIVGLSTFQSDAAFNGNVTVNDGYTLTVNTITSNATNDLTLEGATGFIDIPTGMTLRATGTGQIIATSSSGTTALTVPFNTTSSTVGYAVYVSSNDTTTNAIASAIGTSYCVGFTSVVGSSGEVYTDGLVTPVFNGSAPAVGQPAYLDPSVAGKLTATAPSTSGQVVAPVGFMKNATQMIVRVLTPVLL